MILGVPTETTPSETRVALTPSTAEKFVNQGHNVCITSDAGDASNWSDADYRDMGCTVMNNQKTVFEQADVILQVHGPSTADEIDPYDDGQIIIGLLSPYEVDDI